VPDVDDPIVGMIAATNREDSAGSSRYNGGRSMAFTVRDGLIATMRIRG
jgi:hypothetical protein